jgi:hypothetical protein
MDICKLYLQRGTNPFPYCLASATVTQAGDLTLGECFVLVENGREFFNGQRVVLPADGEVAVWMEQVLEMSHQVVLRMVKAAARHSEAVASGSPPRIQFAPAPDRALADLWHAGRFRAHLKWIGEKSASPQLRQQLISLAQSRRVAKTEANSQAYISGPDKLATP